MYVRKQGDKWRVIVQHDGRRRSSLQPTKLDAQRKGIELLMDLGATPAAGAMDVGELLARWQNTAVLSATYRADIVSLIGRLPDSLTSRPILGVNVAVIEHTYRTLMADGWSAHRVRRLHTVLSSAYAMAVRYEWVASNPFARANKPEVDSPTVRPPTLAEMRTLIEAAPATMKLYLRLSAAIGARRGEIVGLRWADITGTQISIERSLAHTSASGTVVTDTKTGNAGWRVVAITDILAKQLRAHRTEQVAKAFAAGLPSPVWVFSHDAGVTPWRPGYISLEFRRLCARCDITGVRLHDLRHLMATEMLSAGVPMSTVSKRLGHSKVATTVDTYGKYSPAADQAAADMMGQRFDLG